MSDGTGWPTEADYAWADERDALCVCFIESTTPKEVLERMVGECGTGILSVAEAREWVSEQTEPGYPSTIEAGIVGGWVVIVEANGYHLAPVIRRVSTGSRAVVLFRNIHAHTTFLYMVDGLVVRSFDPLLHGVPTPWEGPPLPEESGLDFGSGHPMASAFACAERLTGVRLTLDVLDDHGDWLAIGHYPLHSLTRSAFGAAEPSVASHPTLREAWSEVHQLWSEFPQMWSDLDRVSDKMAVVLLLLMYLAQAVLGVVILVVQIYTSLHEFNSLGVSPPLK